MSIALVLGLLAAAVVLFATERISVDLVTFGLLIVLVVCRILTPQEAFAGFASEIIIILGSLFVIGAALQRTRVMDLLASHLGRLAGGSQVRMITAVMGLTGLVSAFMNNTTATAVFLSPVTGAARRSGILPSKVLLPLAYASILGGTCTLIGTSTNVAVAGYLVHHGYRPLGMFEITPVGLVIVGVGIAYMLLVGRHLLPDHPGEDLVDEYAMREYLTEIIVLPDSHMIGQRIYDSDLSRMEYRILEVIRADEKFVPTTRTRIRAGDILLVEGKIADLMKVKTTAGIEIRPDQSHREKLADEEMSVVEGLVPRQSSLIGHTLKQADFRNRFGMTALAIYRQGQSLRDKVGRIQLRMGDVLLIQGAPERLAGLQHQSDIWVLQAPDRQVQPAARGLWTVLFFMGALVAGSAGWLPLSVAFLLSAVAVILVGAVSVEEAYATIDWRLLVLIGGMTAFGVAMEKTGAAEFVAGGVVWALEPFGVRTVLAGFFLATVLLTQPMSNAAAALVMLPVGIETAQRLGVNERTFAVAIMLAASVSFLTPFEPSCILVYGAGKYRFRDFLKVGGLLTVLLTVAVLLVIPLFWPLAR